MPVVELDASAPLAALNPPPEHIDNWLQDTSPAPDPDVELAPLINRAQRDRRNEMAVHYINMQPVTAIVDGG